MLPNNRLWTGLLAFSAVNRPFLTPRAKAGLFEFRLSKHMDDRRLACRLSREGGVDRRTFGGKLSASTADNGRWKNMRALFGAPDAMLDRS